MSWNEYDFAFSFRCDNVLHSDEIFGSFICHRHSSLRWFIFFLLQSSHKLRARKRGRNKFCYRQKRGALSWVGMRERERERDKDGEKLYISRLGGSKTNSAKICSSFLSFCDSKVSFMYNKARKTEEEKSGEENTSVKFPFWARNTITWGFRKTRYYEIYYIEHDFNLTFILSCPSRQYTHKHCSAAASS